jgi:DNA-binding CsgD family transcriptional regulator
MLTARERLIAGYLQRGMSNKEIGLALAISERGVKFHVTNLLRKTGAENRIRLAQLLADNNAGLLTPSCKEDEEELHVKLDALKQQMLRLKKRQRFVRAVIAACESYCQKAEVGG